MIKIALHKMVGKEQLQGQKLYHDDYIMNVGTPNSSTICTYISIDCRTLSCDSAE